jgi:hypothetical protein
MDRALKNAQGVALLITFFQLSDRNLLQISRFVKWKFCGSFYFLCLLCVSWINSNSQISTSPRPDGL